MNPIEIQNITKKYKIRNINFNYKNYIKQLLKIEKPDYITALKNIKFDVNPGEIFGILGPNGAGKTTLIKILSGLLLPDNGNAFVNGFDIIKNREKVRTSVNILMSGGWIIFDYKFSIYDNLKFWGTVEGIPIKEIDNKVNEVLKIVDLSEKKEDFPENLSAGLRQKMNLARCLLTDRPVYLLDEPTANVDPYSSEFLRDFIKKLKKDGKTIVLATHNLWEAEMLCNRIGILNKGEIIALDKTDKLKKLVTKEIAIIQLDNISKELIKELTKLNYIERVIEKENCLEIYGKVKSNIPEIIQVCQKYTKILYLDTKESSLNDIFIDLIKQKEQKGVIS